MGTVAYLSPSGKQIRSHFLQFPDDGFLWIHYEPVETESVCVQASFLFELSMQYFLLKL